MSWSKASKEGLLSSVNAVFVFKGGRHPVLLHEKEGNFHPIFFSFLNFFWMSSSDISECMSRCVLRSPQSPFPSYCTFGCEKSKERRERHLIMITFKKDFAKQIFFVSEARNFYFPKTVVQCNKEYNFAANIQIKHIFAWQAFYYFFS